MMAFRSHRPSLRLIVVLPGLSVQSSMGCLERFSDALICVRFGRTDMGECSLNTYESTFVRILLPFFRSSHPKLGGVYNSCR
ncbi:hypothetical protein M404DRAFT_650006 [Pisolithus tinctorius Marx 270]|uniref:Secreted protein n=1 Tax=Pisolithus tinctorius Marx 270 TaxID=870435 RepID=A0A0C3J086_PISTI|nr:hypothetical protein M404DRAFT_650006 [Pisolithus tinctorius Marx 270]